MSDGPGLTIFCGRFGCGKTEIAINYALRWVDRGEHPLLVDLDIVTPYFRTRDVAAEMTRWGIEVVAPFETGHRLDVPAISPRIRGAIEQDIRPVVVDLGGDWQGTRAIAQYADAVEKAGGGMYFVVNPYRPFMETPEAVECAIREVESGCRLRVSALVSNPNLMAQSTPDLFFSGHQQVVRAATHAGLPIAFAVVDEAVSTAPDLDPGLEKANLVSWDGEYLTAAAGSPRSVPVLVIRRFFAPFGL